MLRREWMMKNETSLIGQRERTMNLRSLDKTNLSTASIRSNGSSESLILMQEAGQPSGHRQTGNWTERSKEVGSV
jgi:hypothetical protein